jgi:hypothetical protein
MSQHRTPAIILGDWNSLVGDKSHRKIVGSHGLGRQNHRSQMLIHFCDRNKLIVTQHMIQEAKEKTPHMEGTWKLESTSAGRHPCKASIQKQCEECADTA